MGEYNNLDPAIAGLLYGVGPEKIETFRCAEANGIPFGYAVFCYAGDDVNGYLPHKDLVTIVWDADFVTSNSIDVVVNGTTVTTPFNTDHDTTIADIETNIEAAVSGIVVTRTDQSGDNRTLQLFLKAVDLTVTETVTGGASQATGTITANEGGIFAGVAAFTQKEYAEANEYNQDEDMNVVNEGDIYVLTSEAVNSQVDAYVVSDSGANQGKFATSGYATGARFRTTLSAAGLARLTVNGQKTD